MQGTLNRLINRIIIEKIFEIIVAISLLVISAIIWGSFNIGISASNITTLDEYKMQFDHYNKNSEDIIIAHNPYHFNKKYRIFLAIDRNVDLKKSSIMINGEEYVLDNFYCKKKNKERHCLLVNSELIEAKEKYYIKVKLNENTNDYHYIFEENNNF